MLSILEVSWQILKTDSKKYFSKIGCLAYNIWKKYLNWALLR
jgi:hypothetical protein